MANLTDLKQQRAALDMQIAELTQRERSGAIEKVRELVAQFELSQNDVFGAGRAVKTGKSSTAGTKVAPKYRDPVTGATWTGRGMAPKWIAGEKDRSKFLIA